MTGSKAALLGLTLLGVLGAPLALSAQTVAPNAAHPRMDASASVGWFSATEPVNAYDDWYRDSWATTLNLGYYWTEHLKTELEAGLTTEGALYGVHPPGRVSPQQIPRSVRHVFSTRSVAIGQQYQFGRNAWFHPHIVAGVDLAWVRHTELWDAVYLSRTLPSPSVILPAHTVGPVTEVRALAFVGTGFKAYMTERGFFRTDLRVAFDRHVRNATVTLGFGFDF